MNEWMNDVLKDAFNTKNKSNTSILLKVLRVFPSQQLFVWIVP